MTGTVDTTVESWAARIRPHLARTVEGIIAAGRELIEAKAALPHGQFGPLLTELGIGWHMANRFMRVAAHPVLANSAPVRNLPPSISVLDELTRVPDAELVDAIDRGDIGPSTTRRQAASMVARAKADRTDPYALRCADVEQQAEAFLDEVADDLVELAARTDSGVYGPPVQVRDVQLDATDVLVRVLGADGDRQAELQNDLVTVLADARWWREHRSWVTFCSWLLTLEAPDISRPWGDQLAAGHVDLAAAARGHVRTPGPLVKAVPS